MKRRDIGKLRGEVGAFDQPIGAVQLPDTGVRMDRRGDPMPLQSGQEEHPELVPHAPGRKRRQSEPELAFTTDLFGGDPAERAVLTACHKALAGRQVTVHELRTKLETAEHEPTAIENGIERCIAAGLLDDVRYATAYVESRVRRGHGAQRIRQDLKRRGIDRSLVDEAIGEHQESGALDEAAVVAARAKFARVDLRDAKARARATRWLSSRGYSSTQVGAALRTIRAEHAEASGES